MDRGLPIVHLRPEPGLRLDELFHGLCSQSGQLEEIHSHNSSDLGPDATFLVNLPNGNYNVTAIMGGATLPHE